MSKDENKQTEPPSDSDLAGDDDNDDDNGHEEAAEILSDLLQNQVSLSNNSSNSRNANASKATTATSNAAGINGSQVGEAQEAALQQLVQQVNQANLVQHQGHKLGNDDRDSSAALKQQTMAAVLDAMRGDVASATATSAAGGGEKKHAFWDTQPMLQGDDKDDDKSNKTKAIAQDPHWHKPIIPDKDKSELRQEPYNMPKGFEWSEIDISDPDQRTEVYDLLYQNYVEDDDCMFRFDYSRDFLIWALTPPGYLKQFHLGVRSSKSNRLMALITGVPARVRIYEVEKDMVEVNFLCVHKKLRSKRLAPVLIKEITRRVNHLGMFQAVYTAGVVLPGHVASCRYYHRSLDPRKLVEIGFSRLYPRMTMARMQKLYKLPAETSTPGLRPMMPEDVPAAHALVLQYLKKFKLSVVFSVEEFAHWLLPREGVVSSFVRLKEGTGEVTDFCSYYHLHSTVIGNAKYPTLHGAYSFYNVATSVDLTELMRDALILAKNEGHDVFNALNLMDNERFLGDLKFGIGDGNLQYYVYNWFCPSMDHGDVGIVLL